MIKTERHSLRETAMPAVILPGGREPDTSLRNTLGFTLHLIKRYITWNLNNHRAELSRRGQLCRSVDEGAEMTVTIKQMGSKSLDVGGGMENEQWSWMWPLHPRGCSQLQPETKPGTVR